MSEEKSVLLTGGGGQLGKALLRTQPLAGYRVHAPDRSQLDITDERKLDNAAQRVIPKIIINTAAYTHVDLAESHSDIAFAVNAEAVGRLAKVADQFQAIMVHISTDYVFGGEGNSPRKPNDPIDCENVYARSKWEGEVLLRNSNVKHIIIRTSWLYAAEGRNFMNTMLRLGREQEVVSVVNDQIGSPTLADDLASAIWTILESIKADDHRWGTYHYSNQGVASWYDFACSIFDLSGIKALVEPVSSDRFETAAKRPAYSVLDKTDIQRAFGISIPWWQHSLSLCLKIKLNP